MQRLAQLLPPAARIRIRNLLEGNRLARRIYLRDIAHELDAIEAELNASARGPWHDFLTGLQTIGMTERVVEIPWVLSRYQGERRVLDVGPTFGYTIYIQRLNRLGIPELHGIDLNHRPIPGMKLITGDVRRMPYPDGHFDLIHCISTLEHIGFDNSRYGVLAERSADGDVVALAEMRRVLAEDGRLLVTVPFGRPEIHDWFRQFDRETWRALVAHADLEHAELDVYGYSESGWTRRDEGSLPTGGYREMGAPASTGVLCAALVRSASGAPGQRAIVARRSGR